MSKKLNSTEKKLLKLKREFDAKQTHKERSRKGNEIYKILFKSKKNISRKVCEGIAIDLIVTPYFLYLICEMRKDIDKLKVVKILNK